MEGVAACELFRCGGFLVLAVALLVLLARAARTRIVAADLGAIAAHRLVLDRPPGAAARLRRLRRLAGTAARRALGLRRGLAVGGVGFDGGFVVGLVGDAV